MHAWRPGILFSAAAAVLIAAPTAAAPNSAAAESTGSLLLKCEALKGEDFSDVPDAPTEITEAKVLPSQGKLPAHCRVTGYVAPNVGIGLVLPFDHWNGKFIEAGCGGNCGALYWAACSDPLRRGYACVTTDMGHTSTAVDSLWAFNNLQAEIDYGFRATHVAKVAGWAITEHFYNQTPRKSYFIGCSQGGRQGLVAVQRFPWDFDGIVAGAPPISIISGHWIHLLWRKREILDEHGQLNISRDDLHQLHREVLAACDGDDGVQDGIISDPEACKFDPAALQCESAKKPDCLTADQVATVRKIYSDALVPRRGLISRGELPGTELHWERWNDLRVEDKFRYMAFFPDPGARWHAREFNFDEDTKRIGVMEALYDNANPDLRRFKAAGGKLLIYHGWADQSVSPLNTTDYYETVERTLGGRAATQDFARLFMIPGMNHCTGGNGAFAIDYLSYLEAWVEKGEAPEKLVGAHVKFDDPAGARLLEFPLDPSKIEFSRHIYPYPIGSKYLGSGDPKAAQSYGPVSRQESLREQ